MKKLVSLSNLIIPKLIIATLLLSFFACPVAWTSQDTSFSNKGAKRGESQKVIDFDGDLVEGMNKRPYDSLNQVSEGQKKRKSFHLYRKRKSFRTEIRETTKKMRYVP